MVLQKFLLITGINIVGGNINNLRYADDTTLKVESEEKQNSKSSITDKTDSFGYRLIVDLETFSLFY